MRKLFTFLTFICITATVSPAFGQTNLLAGLWDGNGATGTTSKPNDFGWTNTVAASIPWTVANGSGGCRLRDYGVTGGHTGFTYEVGGAAVTTRQLMLRFDNGAYSSSVYSYPVTLEACTSYIFSMDYVCGGSGTPPKNLTVGISTTASAAGRLSTKTLPTTNSTLIYRNGTYTFTTGLTAGVYYITFSGDAVWFGINNLSIVKSTEQSLSVSKQYMFFDDSADNTAKTFNVQGGGLTSAVTLTAPAGISLNKTSITALDAQCGVDVIATFDNTKSISDDTIYLTSGSLTKKIVIDAIKNNLIGSWDGNGDTTKVVEPISLPTKYGWASATVTWAAANLATVGTCRYFDNPASYTYNGVPYLGRILYARWDASNTAGVDGVFTLPIALQKDKYYQFGGKFAWNSNGTAPVIRVGVYAAADTTGTAYSILNVQTGATLSLTSAIKTFAVPADGTYYLTFKSNTLSLNALADLFVRDVTEIVTKTDAPKVSDVNVYGKNNRVVATVNLATSSEIEMRVYNLQGMCVSSSRSALSSGIHSIETTSTFASGVYLVRLLQKGQILQTAKVAL